MQNWKKWTMAESGVEAIIRAAMNEENFMCYAQNSTKSSAFLPYLGLFTVRREQSGGERMKVSSSYVCIHNTHACPRHIGREKMMKRLIPQVETDQASVGEKGGGKIFEKT